MREKTFSLVSLATICVILIGFILWNGKNKIRKKNSAEFLETRQSGYFIILIRNKKIIVIQPLIILARDQNTKYSNLHDKNNSQDVLCCVCNCDYLFWPLHRFLHPHCRWIPRHKWSGYHGPVLGNWRVWFTKLLEFCISVWGWLYSATFSNFPHNISLQW